MLYLYCNFTFFVVPVSCFLLNSVFFPKLTNTQFLDVFGNIYGFFGCRDPAPKNLNLKKNQIIGQCVDFQEFRGFSNLERTYDLGVNSDKQWLVTQVSQFWSAGLSIFVK